VTTFRVRVDQCRFPLHDLSVPHIFPNSDMVLEDGPIAVSRLDNGEWLIQEGRHRVIRARLRGEETIEATDRDKQVTQ
jgi:hypothetical protein